MTNNIDERAERLARGCLENIEDLSERPAVEEWIRTQAYLLWLYQGRPQDAEVANYLRASTHLYFLISDAALNCFRHQTCILSRFSSAHYKLMQLISLEDYLQIKSYLQWVTRTKKERLSTWGEKLEDYLSVSSLFRETLSKCNWCERAPQAPFWTRVCADSLADFDRTIVLKISDAEPAQAYLKYVRSFHNGLYALRTGEVVPWTALTSVLSFMSSFPQAVGMFEVLLARAMLGDYFGRMYGDLIRSGNASESHIAAQAWYFWFLKGCPDQTEQEQKDDFYTAKRYLAYLFSEHIIAKASQEQSPPLGFLTPQSSGLLQSLSLHEYLVHAAVAHELADKRKNFKGIVTVEMQHRAILDGLADASVAWIRLSSDSTRSLADNFAQPMLERSNQILSAKLAAVARLGKQSHAVEAAAGEHVRQFYRTYELPRPLQDACHFVNMFEVAVAGSLNKLPVGTLMETR